MTWQVQGLWQRVGPVQPLPPHWPQRVCSGPSADEVVVGAGVVVVVGVGAGVVLGPGLPVAAAARTDEMEVHAGFLLKLRS